MINNVQRLLLLVFFITLTGSPVCSESDAADRFSHEQEIVLPGGEHDYYSIELSAQQYRNTQSRLEDIRVRDSRGVYCPYVLNSSREKATSETLSYETAAIGIVEEKENDISLIHHDFQVVDFPDEGEVNTIVLKTDARDFSSQVRVYARTAKSDWQPVATDTVYYLDDVEKLSVALDEVPLYQFWRITVTAPSPFTTLSIIPRLDRKRSESLGFLKETSIDFEVTERNRSGRTTLTVKNPDRLRLVSLSLDTGALFKRMVQIRSDGSRLASKQLYRIPSGKDMAIDTTIELDTDRVHDESFEIIIVNGDDEPLPVDRITAQYRLDYLVFRPSGYPPYVLLYGNDGLEKPVYDLDSYKNEVLARDIPAATLAVPILHAVPETKGETGKTLFTVIVIASAAVLFALSLIIFLKKPGSSK